MAFVSGFVGGEEGLRGMEGKGKEVAQVREVKTEVRDVQREMRDVKAQAAQVMQQVKRQDVRPTKKGNQGQRLPQVSSSLHFQARRRIRVGCGSDEKSTNMTLWFKSF